MAQPFRSFWRSTILQHGAFGLIALLALLGILFERLLLPGAVAAALIGTAWLLYNRRSLPATPVDLVVLLLLLLLPLNVWVSPDRATTLPLVWRLVGGVALMYAVAFWAQSKARRQWTALALTLVGVGLALLMPLLLDGGYRPLLDLFAPLRALAQPLSDRVNPNVIAGAVALLAPLPLALLLFDGQRGIAWRLFNGGSFGLMLLSVAVTLSRGALLALLVAVVVLIGLRSRALRLLLPPALILLIVWLWRSGGLAAIGELWLASGSVGSLDSRLEIWSRAIYMISDFPFSGVGMGMFGRVADLLYPFFLIAPGQADHAHNLWLQLAVDLGLPGLIVWQALQLLLLGCGWLTLRSVPAGWHGRPLLLGLLTAQGVTLLHGIIDAPLWATRPAVLVWGLWGLLLALLLAARQEKSPDQLARTDDFS